MICIFDLHNNLASIIFEAYKIVLPMLREEKDKIMESPRETVFSRVGCGKTMKDKTVTVIRRSVRLKAKG